MKQQHSAIEETVTFAGSSYLFQTIAMVRGFVIARFLGPSLYGLWCGLRIFFDSGRFLGLGSAQTMVREVPFNEGKGNGRENAALQQVCFTWYLLSSTAIALGVLCLSFSEKLAIDRLEASLACLVFVINAIRIFIPSKLISEKKIILLSRINILYILLNTLFGLSLMLVWNIKGLLAGMILASGSVLIFLFGTEKLSFRLHFDFALFGRLIRIGFPIMILSTTFFFMQTIDKLVVFFMLGHEYMGYFGLAAFFTEIISHIPGSITVVLFPRMMHALGATQRRNQIERYYTKPVLFLAAVMPFLLGLIWINIDLPIVYLLPQYRPAVEVLRIFVLGLFFFALWGLPRSLLIAFDKQTKLLSAVLVLVLTGTVLDILVIKAGYGLRGVALASVSVFALLTVMANSYALLCLGRTGGEIAAFLLRLYGPFGYVVAGLMLLTVLPASDKVIWRDLSYSGYFTVYNLLYMFCLKKGRDILSFPAFLGDVGNE